MLVETVSPGAVAGQPRCAQHRELASAGGRDVGKLVVSSSLAFESGADDTASVCRKCAMEVAECFAGLSASLVSVAAVPAVVGLQGVLWE